ncbi:MAG TPA: PhzF family phenazine biosynthesis protein [Longimicrobiales bacterium]
MSVAGEREPGERVAGGELFRLAAFTTTPDGGNPAGVWIGEALPDAATMLRIAGDVGFSETAFIAPVSGKNRTVRYYSPAAEVPFCGHATIAAGVLLGGRDGDGRYDLESAVGSIAVEVRDRGGMREAALTSVPPRQKPAGDTLLAPTLQCLGWDADDLDPQIPPVVAFAGSWHLVLAARFAARLDTLDYDFDTLRAIMLGDELTTIQLVWRENPTVFHSRNPFPVGGIVEDPATGAAAAALGGYLRDAGLIEPPVSILIRQGEAMGRPSRITVEIPATGGIVVRGSAIPTDHPSMLRTSPLLP